MTSPGLRKTPLRPCGTPRTRLKKYILSWVLWGTMWSDREKITSAGPNWKPIFELSPAPGDRERNKSGTLLCPTIPWKYRQNTIDTKFYWIHVFYPYLGPTSVLREIGAARKSWIINIKIRQKSYRSFATIISMLFFHFVRPYNIVQKNNYRG